MAPNDRIIPISYEAARIMVLKAGNILTIDVISIAQAGLLKNPPQSVDAVTALKLS